MEIYYIDDICDNRTYIEMRDIMQKVKALYTKYKHVLVSIAYMTIYLLWFAYLEQKNTKHFQVIHMSIDDYIPFCEVFIVPYLLWFAYMTVIVIYFMFTNKTDYWKTCVFLYTGMTVFLVVSTLWPNGHHLRLSVMPRDNIFTQMVAVLWRTDTATNLWPSIHVYNSLGAHFAIINSKQFGNKKGIHLASLILCSSIIMATVFLKQHSMFDVLTAFVMAAIMYTLVYRYDIVLLLRKTNHKPKTEPLAG